MWSAFIRNAAIGIEIFYSRYKYTLRNILLIEGHICLAALGLKYMYSYIQEHCKYIYV